VVDNASADKHAEWHRANNLHAASCGWLRREIAQRSEMGWHLAEVACDCGLATERRCLSAPSTQPAIEP
jgi:hypothetical protein